MTIGWIGTGVMGRSMCGHLLAAGERVQVFTRTRERAAELEERGATWAATAAEAATGADVIFTMTRSHREMLLAQWPEAASRTHLICPQGRDVADPIGGSREIYAACARQIDEALAQQLGRLDMQAAPKITRR